MFRFGAGPERSNTQRPCDLALFVAGLELSGRITAQALRRAHLVTSKPEVFYLH